MTPLNDSPQPLGHDAGNNPPNLIDQSPKGEPDELDNRAIERKITDIWRPLFDPKINAQELAYLIRACKDETMQLLAALRKQDRVREIAVLADKFAALTWGPYDPQQVLQRRLAELQKDASQEGNNNVSK